AGDEASGETSEAQDHERRPRSAHAEELPSPAPLEEAGEGPVQQPAAQPPAQAPPTGPPPPRQMLPRTPVAAPPPSATGPEQSAELVSVRPLAPVPPLVPVPPPPAAPSSPPGSSPARSSPGSLPPGPGPLLAPAPLTRLIDLPLGPVPPVLAFALVGLGLLLMVRRRRLAVRRELELEEAKGTFIRVASHELRTPLTVVRGYLAMAAEGSLSQLSAEMQEVLRAISGNVD